MTPVDFHPLADQELTAVAQYYERQAVGLGSEFLTEAETTKAFLQQFPGAGRLLPHGSRRVSMHRFPYHFIYRIDPDRLLVLAVAHHRRRPGYWAGRV